MLVGLVTFFGGIALGWVSISVLRSKAPRFVEMLETQAWIMIIGCYAQYTRIVFTDRWGLARLFCRSTRITSNAGDSTQHTPDGKCPYAINSSLSLLPWTAVHCKENGDCVSGSDAIKALTHMLSDTANEIDGIVYIRYTLYGDPNEYRMAINKHTTFDTLRMADPLRCDDVDLAVQQVIPRPSILSAYLSYEPGSKVQECVDVSKDLKSFEGPTNNFEYMHGLTLAELLLEQGVQLQQLNHRTLTLKTINGEVCVSTRCGVREAQRRLCALT